MQDNHIRTFKLRTISLEQALTLFLEELAGPNLSPATLTTSEGSLAQWVRFLDENDGNRVADCPQAFQHHRVPAAPGEPRPVWHAPGPGAGGHPRLLHLPVHGRAKRGGLWVKSANATAEDTVNAILASRDKALLRPAS